MTAPRTPTGLFVFCQVEEGKGKHTHRRTTAGERRPPGTTSCPPTCQEAALRIGYPGEETWSRRRRKQRQRAALRLEREPGTVFSCQMGAEAPPASPYHFRRPPNRWGKYMYMGVFRKRTKTPRVHNKQRQTQITRQEELVEV